ncbi:hypothetical protein PYW08_010780 [Mythimna loreyi]|uniref:Uncharacterized protein n=1 Tax=Mythimna loreyi TaxID=667449 RepID=A0ACC2Q3X7_9NEOP|nr:hypothetical protein PYW08_010780 [Mythimna loreyi]
MKDLFSTWLCQTLLIFYVKHITICQAIDLNELENLVRSFYKEQNSNNRRGYYKDSDNENKANQYYEKAYTDADTLPNQQDIARTDDTKFMKSTSPPNQESRKAYAAAIGYSNTRTEDTSEIESAIAGDGSAENSDNDSIIPEGNNTAFGVSASVKSNFPVQPQQLGKDSCTCQGSGANEEISFLCFSTRDGSKNLSIKYKGTIIFDLEDILKGYKLYFDNMQIHNFNIENIINSENNLKHEVEGDSKLNMDISKFKIKDGNFNFNAESKFDINKIKNGNNKFKIYVNKFDVNAMNEDSNKFNFEISKNDGLDIQKYFNNNFKTQFGKNVNINPQMEAWKKIQTNQISLNNNLNGNQLSYETNVQADMQAEIEAHTKALAEAEAVAKAQAIIQAQLEAEAKAQAVLQNQITAQAQAEAQGKAKAHAEAHAKNQMQINSIGLTLNSQSQSQPSSFSDDHESHQNKFINFGIGGEKHFYGNGFNLGFNGGTGGTKFGANYGEKTGGGGVSFGGAKVGAVISEGISKGFGTIGGIGGGMGGGAGGGSGGGAGGGFGISGRLPFKVKSMAGGNDGNSMVMTYTGSGFNYGDDFYDESLDDGSVSLGFPGVLAFSTPNKIPISGSRLTNNAGKQKDGYATFGVTGYQRYP